MTITLRTTKGSELTFAELDGNFTDLDNRVQDSNQVKALIDSAYVKNIIDSSYRTELIDSAYVNARATTTSFYKYFYEAAGNYPFLLKDNFSGIIPAGTPLFQIIPFKRDNWKSESAEFNELNPIRAMSVNRNFWGTYRKQFWTKKSFK